MSKNEINKKESGKDNVFAYISIVAIVAIVAVFVMFAGSNKGVTQTPSIGGNIIGEARYFPSNPTQGPPTFPTTGGCGENDLDLTRTNIDTEDLERILHEIEREGGEVLRNPDFAVLEVRHGRVISQEQIGDNILVQTYEDGTQRGHICYCRQLFGNCNWIQGECTTNPCSECGTASTQWEVIKDKLSSVR